MVQTTENNSDKDSEFTNVLESDSSFQDVDSKVVVGKIFENEKININWYDHNWLSDLIEENKIRIHHEANDDYVLLTAKPRELQKFVTKYVNSEEAFEDGLEAILTRRK